MWLASLAVMCKMARLMESEDDYRHYRDLLDRGNAAFDKLLWNGGWEQRSNATSFYCCLRPTPLLCLGKYYNYDSSGRDHSNSVMSDQCAGHWFLRASGLGDGEYEVSFS